MVTVYVKDEKLRRWRGVDLQKLLSGQTHQGAQDGCQMAADRCTLYLLSPCLCAQDLSSCKAAGMHVGFQIMHCARQLHDGMMTMSS